LCQRQGTPQESNHNQRVFAHQPQLQLCQHQGTPQRRNYHCPLSSFPQPDIQLKHKSDGVQDRRHRPQRYNTSTGTNPEHNKHTCLAHTEPGVPDCRGIPE
ncbi:hypothetical protein Taro_023148, partial [Colocasia esculenta]|nr:hypothetical protein [Colocasia esculenta]